MTDTPAEEKPEQVVVIVDRSKWRCGGNGPSYLEHGNGPTSLLNPQGYMCCLGFACEQLGVERHALMGTASPGHLVEYAQNDPKWQPEVDKVKPYMLEGVDEPGNSDIVVKCININDTKLVESKEQREQLLIEATKDAPFTFQFVGEYESHNTNEGETNGS